MVSSGDLVLVMKIAFMLIVVMLHTLTFLIFIT